MTASGPGTLILGGSNTYTGGTTVSGGLLEFSSGQAIPSGSGNITINSGGAVLVAGVYPTVTGWLNSGNIASASAGALALMGTDSEAITMGSYASLSLGASGAATYSGALTPAGSIYRLGGGGGTLTFTPAITSGSLAVSGPGIVVLTAANTYPGSTTVSAGTLSITGTVSGSSAVTADAGGAISLSGSLAASNEYVGYSAAGTFTETAGTNDITSGASISATMPAAAGPTTSTAEHFSSA